MAQSGTISGSFREFWAGVFCGLVLRVFQNLVETIEPVQPRHWKLGASAPGIPHS